MDLAPRVSVIIPTYNRAAELRRAIMSVAAQAYTDYEIIVVDDGSTDATAEVIDAVPAGWPLRYFHQANRGRSAARNAGLRAARGEFIAFLDSDDAFLPGSLQVRVEALDAQPAYGMVYCHYLGVSESGESLPRERIPHWRLSGRIYPELLFVKGTIITTPSVIVRARLLEEVGGFDESLHMCEDLDLWRRVARRSPVLQIMTPYAQVTYRENEPLAFEAKFRARSAYLTKAIADDSTLNRSFQRKLWADMYWEYGRGAIRHGEARKGWLWLARGLLTQPWLLGQYAAQALWRKIRALGQPASASATLDTRAQR